MIASTQLKTVEQEIGLRVKERRMQLRLSQEALGKAVGVSFQQIQKYEKGKNRISHSTLLDLAKVLQVDISYFTPLPQLEDFNFNDINSELYLADRTNEYEANNLKKEVEELVRAFISIKDPKIRQGFLTIIKSRTNPNIEQIIKQKVTTK
jgi:transcriptional regulator with XRE-family HTH domain